MSPYDQVAYPGVVYPFATPDRLSVFATLFGLAATPPPDATVIELGCGDGANLLGIAQRFPTATLIGVDASEAALARARATSAAAGLTQVQFIRLDLASPDTPLPPCDYLIAHGLLSWIPPAVRRNVLALAGRLLRPHGLALLSFLTYPGQHDLEPLRGLMRHHVAKVTDPHKRVTQARQIAHWHLARTRALHGEARALLLQDLVDEWDQLPDAAFLHDLLADERHPLTLSAMASEAAQAGLAWLTNARTEEPRNELLAEDLREFVSGVADPVARQAYLDAFLMTRFRTSVFARSDAPIRRDAQASDFLAFAATSLVPRASLSDARGLVVNTQVGQLRLSPEASQLLRTLADHRPQALPLAALGDPNATGLAASELWLAGAIELTLGPPALAPTLSATPTAPPLVRHLATTRRELPQLSAAVTSVPTLWQRELPIGPDAAALLAACDGNTPLPAADQALAEALFREGLFTA